MENRKAPSFPKRLSSMLKVDFRRMGRSLIFWILIASALLMPVLMTIMMTMMDGSASVNPQTGVESVVEGPENTWQNIGTLPGEPMGGSEIFMMCNINMVFLLVAVFICLFISEDFRSGFAKNLFAVRAKKGDYVFSKTVCGFLCGALLLLAYFAGSVLGGAMAGLSFSLRGLNAGNLAMCLLSKLFLMPVFVAIDVTVSVAAKQKGWLCLCGSLGVCMLLFMTVSLITPLSATPLHAALCLAGGILFAVGLGRYSKKILNTTALV